MGAAMLLVAFGAARTVERVTRRTRIDVRLEMVADIRVAGEAGLVGHARKRGAVAGAALVREEAVRVGDLAGVPRHADKVR